MDLDPDSHKSTSPLFLITTLSGIPVGIGFSSPPPYQQLAPTDAATFSCTPFISPKGMAMALEYCVFWSVIKDRMIIFPVSAT